MKNLLTVLTLFMLFTLYSCDKRQEFKSASADVAQKEMATDQKAPDKLETTVDRKIIKEGEISFETSDIQETKSLITKTVQELNGYISKDDANDYSGRLENRLTIRVPSDKFDLLLKRISESVKKLDSKTLNVLDVTAEYIDIDARIKTKKELQERYREILKRAGKVDEILSIEKEIGQLETDIESVQGQMNYLKDRISYSTLSVTYYEKTSVLSGFSSKFGRALKDGWDFLLLFIVAVAHLWTFILLGFAVYFVVKLLRRKKQNDR